MQDNEDPRELKKPSCSTPVDFGRRRVRGILRREKPLYEQDAASFDLNGEMVRMLGVDCMIISFPNERMFSLYGGNKGHRCEMKFGVTFLVKWWVKSKPPVNFNSRFYRLPSPGS